MKDILISALLVLAVFAEMTINYSIGLYRRLLYCDECRAYTVHHQLPSGEWQCWCERVEPKIENVQRDGRTPSMEKALQDAGFGSYGPL